MSSILELVLGNIILLDKMPNKFFLRFLTPNAD